MVCAAIGLCQSQQVALAKAQTQEQLMSNEIPQVDLSQRAAPFLLNVPLLLYPQESPKQEAPKQETPKQVRCLTPLCTHKNSNMFSTSPAADEYSSFGPESYLSCRKVMLCARTASSSWPMRRRKPRPTLHLLTLSFRILRNSVTCWGQSCLKWWEPHLSGGVEIKYIFFFCQTTFFFSLKMLTINCFSSLQCKQYVSQYGTLVVLQLMSMVSPLTLPLHVLHWFF